MRYLCSDIWELLYCAPPREKVVSDVLEKVAREIIAEVAEKMIREEIDALKKSIIPED
jgi:hypothetical protein